MATRRILVVSPEPSHPQMQGNSARIFAMCSLLQSLGYEIHFLYFAIGNHDGLSIDAMRKAWGHVYVQEPVVAFKPQSLREHYHIDDWIDPQLGQRAADICRTWRIDTCLANYVWTSGVFEYLPRGVVRVLDTHDVFADRNQRFAALGVHGAWYHTTRAMEQRGVLRADVVVAIQQDEALWFRELGARQVVTLGYLSPYAPVAREDGTGLLRVGYIGSDNPFNSHAIEGMLGVLESRGLLGTQVECSVAGSVCRRLDEDWYGRPGVRVLGRIDRLEHFYAQVDVAVNPMQGGTGLKIKTLEAMSMGVPVLGTPDAYAGTGIDDALLVFPDVGAIADRLLQLADDEHLLPPLERCSEQAYRYYTRQQRQALAQLAGYIP